MKKSITTTDLRTKTKQVVLALHDGQIIDLVHRSKVVGEIRPKPEKAKTITPLIAKKLDALIEQMNLPQLSPEEREKNYRTHLEKKYGRRLS